jgi:hypothetical protein
MGVVNQEERERVMSFARQVDLWLAEQSRRGEVGVTAKAAPEKLAGAAESKEPAKAEKSP